jgi:hypothetical protein
MSKSVSRRDYYDGLRGISERGAWNDWLEYFLLEVARMSEDALSRAMRINLLLAEWQKKVSGESSNNPLRIVELMGANPFITTRGVTDKLAIAFTTAQARHQTTGTCEYRKTGRRCEARPSLLRNCVPRYPRRAGLPQASRQPVALSALEPGALETGQAQAETVGASSSKPVFGQLPVGRPGRSRWHGGRYRVDRPREFRSS